MVVEIYSRAQLRFVVEPGVFSFPFLFNFALFTSFLLFSYFAINKRKFSVGDAFKFFEVFQVVVTNVLISV